MFILQYVHRHAQTANVSIQRFVNVVQVGEIQHARHVSNTFVLHIFHG